MAAAVAFPFSATAASTPWEEYLQRPTSERAVRVQNRTYSGTTVDPTQQEEDLRLLEVQVLSRDPEAIRLAFRFRATADGHIGEILDIMLGRLIRLDAQLFLRETLRAGAASRRLDSLVGSCGPAYVDRSEAQSYERGRRIAALQAVSETALRPLRDKCIAALQK